jgi:pimeloyl-ACP methyl ester carboxylesterase
MASVVKMPKWGLTMTVGTVTDWLRDEGTEFSAGDPLLTVETEKAVNDIEAPADGVLIKIVAPQGTEVPVSGAIAIIGEPGESLSDDEIATLIASAETKKTAPAARTSAGGGAARDSRTASRDDSGRINASPAARKRAAELGIDLASIEATGPGGRVTSDDVERAAAELSADPTPREEQVTLVDGRSINALIAGPGGTQTLVFLHGLGGSQSTWQVVLGDLVERYRVLAIDLPGHGSSDKGDSATVDYSVESLSAAVAEAIEAFKAGPTLLIGHSLGGAIALQMAVDRPDLVTGVVLINSAGLGSEISPSLVELMDREPGQATARGMLELFYDDQRLVVERGIADMAQMQTAEGAWPAQQAIANAAFGNGFQKVGVRHRLGEMTKPVLIIWGSRDRVIPASHAIDALSALPDSTLKLLPSVGHVPQVEDAPAVAVAVDRFAKSLA